MKKIAIIGAGISGLSVGQMLKDKGHKVVLFESESRPGGLIKCDIINGNLFHRTGGHVFNTKRQEVMDWFWEHFDRDNEFKKITRNSAVYFADAGGINDSYVPYPIENHSYFFDANTQRKIIADWIDISSQKLCQYDNFEAFLLNRFGRTLYKIYFQPYNKKVWRRSLSEVPLDWLADKLPMPTVEDMIFNNMNHIEERQFVHSTFFYPKKGGSQFLSNRLAENLNVNYNSPIEKLERQNCKWLINGDEFDEIVFCGNIKQIPSLLNEAIDLGNYTSQIEALEFHGTTSVFCEIDKNPYSWLYMPDEKCNSHRIICTGNFSEANNMDGKMTATVEFTDYISKEDILKELSIIPLNPRYITHNYEKYTYPIQNKVTREMVTSLNAMLSCHGLHLLGRFAQWEYSNMDVCIGFAMDLVSRINKNSK